MRDANDFPIGIDLAPPELPAASAFEVIEERVEPRDAEELFVRGIEVARDPDRARDPALALVGLVVLEEGALGRHGSGTNAIRAAQTPFAERHVLSTFAASGYLGNTR